jgi:hypothetical protein
MTLSYTICAWNARMSSASRSLRTRRSAAEPTISVIMIVRSWADGLRSDKACLRVSC